MNLYTFNLRPLKGSKFHFRVRIWETQAEMERAVHREGIMTGPAQACFCGHLQRELRENPLCIGEVGLWDAPTLRLDAIHELTHAAVHYAREVRGGNLARPHNGEYAPEAEELLCRTMEHLLGEFFIVLNRFSQDPAVRATRIRRAIGRRTPYSVRALRKMRLTWPSNVSRGILPVLLR